jgi:hypothetical protein
MRKKLSLSAVGIIAIVFLVLCFGIDSIKVMPDNALLIVDEETKTYFAPPFFNDNAIEFPNRYRYARAGEIRGTEYEPNAKCRDQGYFCEDGGCVLWCVIERAGLVKSKSRWNNDGTWNW